MSEYASTEARRVIYAQGYQDAIKDIAGKMIEQVDVKAGLVWMVENATDPQAAEWAARCLAWQRVNEL